jgi:hypothetical protein
MRIMQAAMRSHHEASGFEYIVTDSVDVAIEALKEAGILRRCFSAQ